MFVSLARRIRGLHWGARLALWPLLGVAWLAHRLVLAPIAWAAKELGGQAKTGMKKLFAPLLWPMIIIAALAALLLALGTAQFAQIMGLLLQVGVFLVVMYFAARVVIGSLKPTPKNKRLKHRRGH